MVSGPAPALTRSGFRRDVKLFLALLVGFLAMLVLALLAFESTNIDRAEEALWSRENRLVDAAMAELRTSGADVNSALIFARAKYAFSALELVQRNGATVRSGFAGPGLEPIERSFRGGTLRFYIDTGEIRAMRRRFELFGAVAAVATAAGLLLLFLYVPHILRPIEAMLDEARELGEHRGDADEAAYLIDTFRNSIATLKTQEAELKRLHEFEKTRADDLQTITSTLTRSLSSGFIALGPDDRVVDANGAAREILELPREAALADRTIADVLGDNAFAESLGDAARRREPLTRHEIELTRADGTPKIIGLTTVPLLSAADRFLGTLALFTELTQVRRLESRVRELQTLADLGVMSAGIAHEFRNSLSTILGMVKLARRTEVSPEVDRRLVAVETEANQLAAAVTSLLQFARPMRLQLAETDLRELLETQVARLRESEPAIEFTFDAEPATIRGDATILARAFDNLLRNAIDAVAENETRRAVSVTVRGGEEPVVEIADNGIGIDEHERANLFLPFHSTKPNGVGLGLPLARKIVLLHGGTITINSARGEGTTVRVSLAAQPDV